MSLANRILKVPMGAPHDLSSVAPTLEAAGLKPEHVRAVMCMTEGDGFARGFCELAFANYFADALGLPRASVPRRIPMIMIGGCSGLVSPYAALFCEDPGLWVQPGSAAGGGLAIAVGTTADISMVDFGRPRMVELVAAKVRELVEKAGMTPADVHCVQIKAPWPSGAALSAAAATGVSVATTSEGVAGLLSRSAGALGVALALEELPAGAITDQAIGRNFNLYSQVASASAGTERTDVAVMVMGNAPCSASPFRIGHALLKDGADLSGVYSALASAGVGADRPLSPGPDNPVDHVFLKSAVELTGSCRGRRHVLGSDYLGPYSWLIAKAVVHTLVTSVVGDPMMQVSGGGEHQGIPGGGAVAIVARRTMG